MDAKTIGELAEQLQRHADHQHADVLRRRTSASAARSSSRTCATRSSAPRSCASRWRRRSRRSSACHLLEGYGCTEMAPVVAVNLPGTRCRGRRRAHRPGTVGHPLPGVAAKVVDPDDGRGTALRQGRPAARHGPEPDARLSRTSPSAPQKRCATAGTSRATSRPSTRTGSSGSPIGCRASARSPARWCRT